MELTGARARPPGAASAHHVDDVVLRARLDVSDTVSDDPLR
jgi:hypothetical protein